MDSVGDNMNQIYVLVCNENGKMTLCFTDNELKDDIGDEYQVQYDDDYQRIVKSRDKMNELYKTDTREYFISTITVEPVPFDTELQDDIVQALSNYRLVQQALKDHVGVKLTSSLINRVKTNLTKLLRSV